MSWLAKVRSDVFDYVSAITEIAALTDTDIVSSRVPPVVEKQDLSQRLIAVFVESAAVTIASRTCKTRSFTVWITIVDPLTQGQEDSQAEANQLIVDAIEAAVLGARLGGQSNALCTAFEQTVVVSPRHWHEFRQFATYIKLTVEV